MLLDDVEQAVALGKQGHALSDSAHLPFDEAGAKLLGAQCCCSKRLCAFVAVDGDKIVGVLLGMSDKLPYLKADYATDLVTYAEAPGAGRLLIQRFKRWALHDRRVDLLRLGASFGGSGQQATTALYKRLGFRHVGGMFVQTRGEAGGGAAGTAT